jgi:predicted Zn-ribbon and HTH transcriptional regulator
VPELDTHSSGSRRRRNTILRLTLAGLPELELFPSKETRETALWEVGNESGGEVVKGLLPGILLIALVVLLAQFVSRGLMSLIHWPRAVEDSIQLLLVAMVAFAAIRTLHRRGFRQALRHKLLAIGVPICVQCGYALRGLPPSSKRCPECGIEVEEKMRSMIAQDNVRTTS